MNAHAIRPPCFQHSAWLFKNAKPDMHSMQLKTIACRPVHAEQAVPASDGQRSAWHGGCALHNPAPPATIRQLLPHSPLAT